VPRTRCGGPLFAVCRGAEPGPRRSVRSDRPAAPRRQAPARGPGSASHHSTALRFVACCAAPGARRGVPRRILTCPGRAAVDRSLRSAAAQIRGLVPRSARAARPLRVDRRRREAPVLRRITPLRFASLRAAPRPGHAEECLGEFSRAADALRWTACLAVCRRAEPGLRAALTPAASRSAQPAPGARTGPSTRKEYDASSARVPVCTKVLLPPPGTGTRLASLMPCGRALHQPQTKGCEENVSSSHPRMAAFSQR
jgi:hypothetical protein